MDNFQIHVVSEGRVSFDAAIRIAFDSGYTRATHYSKTPLHGFVLYWSEEKGNESMNLSPEETVPAAIPLPMPMGPEAAADLLWHWLEDEAKYPPEPGHDGSNGKGFEVYNEDWGHCAKSPYGFVGVKPEWAWYGK